MTISDGVVIDPQAQARLHEWGGPKLLTQMLKLFLENAPQRVEQVRKGVTDSALKEVERGAHSLKSSAANVGAVTVSKIAAEIEDKASGDDAAAVVALLPRLEAAFGQAQAQLATSLAGMEAGA